MTGGSRVQHFLVSAYSSIKPILLPCVGSVMVGRLTYDREVAGSTPGRVTIKWLLLGWATADWQTVSLDKPTPKSTQPSISSR